MIDAIFALDDRSFVIHTRVGIKRVVVFQVLELKVGREGRQAKPAARLEGSGHTLEDWLIDLALWKHFSCARSPSQAKRSLAERDNRIELSVEGQVSGVADEEFRIVWRPVSSDLDESSGDIDANDVEAPFGQVTGVTARATANVEHSLPRFKFEQLDERVDLLPCAFRKAVAQVGRPEMVGDVLKPVSRHR